MKGSSTEYQIGVLCGSALYPLALTRSTMEFRQSTVCVIATVKSDRPELGSSGNNREPIECGIRFMRARNNAPVCSVPMLNKGSGRRVADCSHISG